MGRTDRGIYEPGNLVAATWWGRLELEEMLGRRIHFFLFVKVREKWGEDPERYRDWGLDYEA